jgi:hypothetical protein
MHKHQFLSSTRKVLAVIPVMAVLLAGTTSAMAQITSSPSALAAAALLAPQPIKSTKVVVFSGSVPFGTDSIVFTNQSVEIGSTLSRDADPTVPPQLIVDLRFINAKGVATLSKVVYTADAQVSKVRQFAANDVLEVTFPFVASTTTALVKTAFVTSTTAATTSTTTTDATTLASITPSLAKTDLIVKATKAEVEAPSGKATFTLTFDTSGTITGALVAIGANTFTP